MDLNTERFWKHLDASQEAVMTVAEWLRGMGFPVRINPTTKLATKQERLNLVDLGDLEIGQRIEVKRRGVQFTGRQDWPYEDFSICAVHAWDKARPKPHAFVILSQDMATAGICYGRDAGQWTKAVRPDRRYDNYRQEFYSSPLDLVRWQRIR